MTQAEKYRSFFQKVSVGKRKNEECLACVDTLLRRVDDCEIGLDDAVALAWSEGCKYGQEHHEELKELEK